MKHILKDKSGISLVELVASLPLAILVAAMLGIVLINFVTSYQETKLYVQLQEELFSAIETIRYGYLYERFTDDPNDDPKYKRPIVGLMTTNQVELGVNERTILLKQQDGYNARFRESSGKLLLDLIHPNMSETGITIFPSIDQKVGNDERFELINDDVFTVEKGSLEKPEMLRIKLKGKVRYRSKSKNQTTEDDERLNTRTVEFETLVYLGNIKNG